MRQCLLLLVFVMPVSLSGDGIQQAPNLTPTQLVNLTRFLNTQEVNYLYERGEFADRDELISFLDKTGRMAGAPAGLSRQALAP